MITSVVGTNLSVTFNGTGSQILSGTSTYTDPTTVNSGMLEFGQRASLYNGGTAISWAGSNIIVKNERHAGPGPQRRR